MGTPRIDRLDKNYIINGGMDIWQRNTSFTVAKTGSDGGASAYCADHTSASLNRNGFDIGMTVTQQTDVPNSDLVYSSRVACNGSYTFGSSSAYLLSHLFPIEGSILSDLGPTDDIYISFYIKSLINVPALSVAIRKSVPAGGSTYDYSYLWTEALTANTWKRVYKKLTLPGAAIHKGTSKSFELLIGGLAGSGVSAYTSSLETWNSGSLWAASTATNWAATSGNWLQVTGVKMSKYPHDSFSLAGRTLVDELRLCQRYFEKSYPVGITHGAPLEYRGSFSMQKSGTTGFLGDVRFSEQKIKTPLITLYAVSNGAAGYIDENGTPVIGYGDEIGTSGFLVRKNTAAVDQAYYRCQWTADADI